VNKLFPADKLMEETEAYARKLVAGATVAIGSIKRCVYDGIDMALHDALAYERQLMAPLFETEDAAEGFAAFAERRPPVYKGR
jgi:enoyl-CoA hydratase/carnithine racemase